VSHILSYITALEDPTDATLGQLDTRSLSGRVREELLRAIRSDAFPDDRLPPEADLAAQLGVSRTTVRAALQSLADDGLVSRRRRHGTVVNRHLLRSWMPLNRLVPFPLLIEQAGHTPTSDAAVHRAQGADDQAAEALQLSPRTPCLVVERVLRADERPVIVVTDTIPMERLPALAEIVEAESTFAFLRANGAGTVDYARSEIVPCITNGTAPKALDLAPGTPYIELRETLFTREHERIAYSRVAVDDSLIRFSLLRRNL
jgi:GntR family transcriptional regulator